MIQLLADLDKLGKEQPSVGSITVAGLVNADSTGTKPMPFFEDDSVNSSIVTQLATNPFNDDIAYGSVVGTSRVLSFAKIIDIDLYQSFQPMDPKSSTSYFPWIYQFDSAAGETDGVVPTWSASLGVSAYNYSVDLNHISLVQAAAVQQKALAWLNDPNLPLGSQQRATYNNQPPTSDRNAYQGATTVDSTNRLTGGGVNPDAIVGVSFAVTGMGPARWDTLPGDVGIKQPVLTGMIRIADIGATDFRISAAWMNADPSLLDDLGKLGLSALNVPSGALSHASLDDWVPFRITIGRVGRRHDQILTGPSGDGGSGADQAMIYQMSDLPSGRSPGTLITLPPFSLPAPVTGAWSVAAINPNNFQMPVTLAGAVEVGNASAASQTTTVDLYLDGLFGPLLAESQVLVSNPAGVWDGLLVPYSTIVLVYKDSNGEMPNWYGAAPHLPVQVYQYLKERWLVSNARSADVTISG